METQAQHLPYRLLVFDMDGTFMDSKDFHTKVFHRFINRYIGPMSYEATRRVMGDTVRCILKNAGVPDEEMKEMFARLHKFCQQNIDDLVQEVPVAPGIVQALSKSRARGYHIALLTNSMQQVAVVLLQHHRLLECFDAVSGADAASMDKTARCRQLMEQFGTTPDQTVCIGDAEFDFVMARAVGCDSCFVKTPLSWYKDEAYILRELRPNYVVTALEQLPDVFEEK